jgi:predicted transcriptional regulator
MKTIELTDELIYKLQTLYEHLDQDKHYSGDIEEELDLVGKIAIENHKQKFNA